MGERSRPRGLYDIIMLFRGGDLLPQAGLIWPAYVEKCESKGLEVFTSEAIQGSPFRVELEGEWANMLAHQLPALPPFGHLWAELAPLFEWLEGEATPPLLTPIPVEEDIDTSWSPPDTDGVWRQGIPLQMVRFASANHLCVELGTQDGPRLVEPYTLKRTLSGQLVLYTVESDTGEVRSYIVDEIHNVRMTSLPFKPRFAVEVASPAIAP